MSAASPTSGPKSGAPSADSPEDSIGERIEARRKLKGLTHDGLAKLTKLLDKAGGTGISRTTIRGYEHGLYKPGTRELRLLSQALEVTPTWLIFGTAEPAEDGAHRTPGLDAPPPTELQKFLIALPLLQLLEPSERQVVYDVLHSLAKMKAGETAYRGHVISMSEVGAFLGDVWSDLKDGRTLDQDQLQNLAKALQEHVKSRLEREAGLDLKTLMSGALGAAKEAAAAVVGASPDAPASRSEATPGGSSSAPETPPGDSSP